MGRNDLDLGSISTRPYVRWWWFAGPIDLSEIADQLRWLKDHGFGGVEIAWVYSIGRPAVIPGWLGKEWGVAVAHAKAVADDLGLGCDFTFGSLWPFGDGKVRAEDSSHTFEGPSSKRLLHTWEHSYGVEGRIIDHLSEPALRRYAARLGQALAPALQGSRSSLFCDSWEISAMDLWSPRLWDEFGFKFGYRLEDFLKQDAFHEDIRYDYYKFLSDVIIDSFYRPFTAICHDLGAYSRVQCHGSPTDLLAAYAAVDIPESEALLFPVSFSRIAASAAALTGKPIVSAEAFTCLYGFPDAEMDREEADDLRLLGNALIANGVNHIIWHGMPYNTSEVKNRFFATTHVGPDANFVDQLEELNTQFSDACEAMRWGNPISRLAVFLPVEDNRMRGPLPTAFRTPAAQYFWELRYEQIPAETIGFAPIWVSSPFLESAQAVNTRMRIGPLDFDGLYVDVKYLEKQALKAILDLANAGVPIVMRRRPLEPGRSKSQSYELYVNELFSLPCVYYNLVDTGIAPILEAEDLPYYWVRAAGDELCFFFAHPAAGEIRYPMRLNQAKNAFPSIRHVRINHHGVKHEVALRFESGRSVIVRVRPEGAIQVESA